MKFGRSLLPLRVRQLVGPYIGYIIYRYHLLYKPKIHVLSISETIHEVVSKKLSVIRFGDGEISSIADQDLLFQKKDTNLASALEKILQVHHPQLLICIPPIWDSLDELTTDAFWFQIHHLFKYRKLWYSKLSTSYRYGNAFITRPYLLYKNKQKSQEHFSSLFSIWENRDVVLIEGSKSRLGVGNDMFKKTQSLQRILCPAENAYSHYDSIKLAALTIDTKKIILLSLGPTAKVLAYDLFLAGYQVLDIGHIDMEYEMFLRKEKRLTKIPFKYFSEINARNPEECSDPTYLQQIIATIE